MSCETENNKKSTLLYLDGKQNFMGIADPNHNGKNGRGQIVSGTSPSSIGWFVADPWMLKKAGVAKELYRIVDWASDGLVLKLCSPKTISKLMTCHITDVGNLSTLVVSLTFIRLRIYSVNASNLCWKERCIYQFLSLLWFTSFHTPYRYVIRIVNMKLTQLILLFISTMLPNKRNMLLETVGLLFLFTRDDVSQGSRLTSECNEHTYGFWRMIIREFSVEQLIRIVQKVTLKTEAIFESNLEVSRLNKFKGYQSGTQDFINRLKQGCNTHGLVHVDLTRPAVDQLWTEVKGIVSFCVSLMTPFLKSFGVEEGNGLSPFAVHIATPQ